MPEHRLGYAGEFITTEAEALRDFEVREGVALDCNKRISVGNGININVDGYSDSKSTVCEVSSRVGPPQGAQPSKIMEDALKMLFLERHKDRPFRKVLIFVDEDAMRLFQGRSWMAACLRSFDIEVWLADISEVTRHNLERQRGELRR